MSEWQFLTTASVGIKNKTENWSEAKELINHNQGLGDGGW